MPIIWQENQRNSKGHVDRGKKWKETEKETEMKKWFEVESCCNVSNAAD